MYPPNEIETAHRVLHVAKVNEAPYGEREAEPTVLPRVLREKDAAAYIGFTPSFLKNSRVADGRAIARGEQPRGPRWLNLGGPIRYEIAELDAWLERGRVAEAA